MTNEQLKEMADRIKARRDKLGFTQEQFAEVIEISLSSYSKIENAFQKPALDTLIRISEKLGVSLDYLVFGDAQPQPASDEDLLASVLALSDSEKLGHARDVLNRLIKIKNDAM